MAFDPLDGIESYPAKTQIALLAQELRNQRRLLQTVNRQQWWILTSLVGLMLTLIGGLSIVIVTGGHA